MIWMAIDTTCDESCAAIIDTDKHRLLADVVHSHVGKMSAYGGVVPEIASREHLKGLPLAVNEALAQAGLNKTDLEGIAVSNAPGLIGALLVGVSYAKALAFSLGIRFLTLNHVEAHLFSPLLGALENEKTPPPPFPWIALVVSGGHTELFKVRGPLDYEWLGGTLDDAAGEAFDKIGKILGLPYPAGPMLDKWVRENASAEDLIFQFPIAQTKNPLDFSFSGLKTHVAQKTQKIQNAGKLDEHTRLQIAACSQQAIVEALVRRLRKAQSETGIPNVVVTGGVACNSGLRQALPDAFFPLPRHCTDNAAMVAQLAMVYTQCGKATKSAPLNATAFANAPLDQA